MPNYDFVGRLSWLPVCLFQHIGLNVSEMISTGPLDLLLIAVERLSDTSPLRLVSEGEGARKHGGKLVISASSSNMR